MGNVELKYKDTYLGLASVPANDGVGVKAIWSNGAGAAVGVTTGVGLSNRAWFSVQNLCCTNQGQGASERIGRKITIKSIRLNMGLFMNMTVARRSTWCVRVMLVWDKQTNGTFSKDTDLFTLPYVAGPVSTSVADTATIGIMSITALPAIENSQRFKILLDKTYNYEFGSNTVASGEGVSGTTQDRIIEIYKKVNLEIEQSTTSAVITGMRSNNVSLWVCANCTNSDMDPDLAEVPMTGVNTGTMAPYGWARIRYTDS